LNYNEVKEEDKKNQIDPKAEFKKQKEIQEGKELLYRKELEEKGLEYERVKALEVTIDEANKKNKEIQKKIRNANNGFASKDFFSRKIKFYFLYSFNFVIILGFEDSSLRKYKRQVNNLKPNLDEYNEKKQETEEDPELNANTYGLSTPVAESKIDALIEDLNKQFHFIFFSDFIFFLSLFFESFITMFLFIVTFVEAKRDKNSAEEGSGMNMQMLIILMKEI